MPVITGALPPDRGDDPHRKLFQQKDAKPDRWDFKPKPGSLGEFNQFGPAPKHQNYRPGGKH